MKLSKQNETESLYIIFERHLYEFHDPEVDRKTFVRKVATDYLSFLRQKKIVIPRSLEEPILEELCAQVTAMLLKKIYGCTSIQEFQQTRPAREVKSSARKALAKYTKLTKKA